MLILSIYSTKDYPAKQRTLIHHLRTSRTRFLLLDQEPRSHQIIKAKENFLAQIYYSFQQESMKEVLVVAVAEDLRILVPNSKLKMIFILTIH